MSKPFCVARDPWITVRVRADLDEAERAELGLLLPGASVGGRAEVGLGGLLHCAHLLADLEVAEPPVETVLRRFLAALVLRVGGLDVRDGNGWLDAREDLLGAGRFDAGRVDAYFARQPQRWWLYGGPRPFLQDPRLVEESPGMGFAGRLAMDRPSGDNPVWAERVAQEEAVPAARSVGWLLAWHGLGPSGTVTYRTRNGRKSRMSNAGPYRALISFFPRHPGSLFVSLMLSVPHPAAWPNGPGADHAPWESEELADPAVPAVPSGPVSLLTARTAHAVLLEGDAVSGTTGCRVTWGTSVPLPAAVDPYTAEQDPGGPLRAERARAMWRDLDALLLHERSTRTRSRKTTVRRPAVFDSLAELPSNLVDALGVRAVAWDQEGKDRSKAWYTATTPPVLRYLTERDADRAAAVSEANTRAAQTAEALGTALEAAWTGAYPKRRTDLRYGIVEQGQTWFWERAEAEFWRTVRDPGTPPGFRHIALECFDTATASLKTSPRARHAVARARAILLRRAAR
ncbi:MAG TPA: type I-E CRISPR-associated protein Cse1/CasA [Streptomyces sp.]